MHPSKINKIVDQGLSQFKNELGWDEIDCSAGLKWLTALIILMHFNDIPFWSRKFPEVLRVLANTLDLLNQEQDNEKNEKES